MAGSLISYEAVYDGPLSRSNLVGKVLANAETKQQVEDILEAQREQVAGGARGEPGRAHGPASTLCSTATSWSRDEILEVIEKALAARP